MYPFPVVLIQVSTNRRFSTAMEGPREIFTVNLKMFEDQTHALPMATPAPKEKETSLTSANEGTRWKGTGSAHLRKHMDCFHIPSFCVCVLKIKLQKL